MGANRRYANSIDRATDERLLESLIAQAGPLQSLTAEELRLDRVPLTVDPTPKPVKAWVRFGGKAVRVEAELLRWTNQACGIEFTVRAKRYRCWVWANAVEETP